MQNIRSTNTKAERMVKEGLIEKGLEFETHVKELIGKPDFVFRDKKTIVFVDSDFWHRHPSRFQMPKTNPEYWQKKIQRNQERDKEVNEELRKQGWNVIRVWEYDVKHNLEQCIAKIMSALGNT